MHAAGIDDTSLEPYSEIIDQLQSHYRLEYHNEYSSHCLNATPLRPASCKHRYTLPESPEVATSSWWPTSCLCPLPKLGQRRKLFGQHTSPTPAFLCVENMNKECGSTRKRMLVSVRYSAATMRPAYVPHLVIWPAALLRHYNLAQLRLSLSASFSPAQAATHSTHPSHQPCLVPFLACCRITKSHPSSV